MNTHHIVSFRIGYSPKAAANSTPGFIGTACHASRVRGFHCPEYQLARAWIPDIRNFAEESPLPDASDRAKREPTAPRIAFSSSEGCNLPHRNYSQVSYNYTQLGASASAADAPLRRKPVRNNPGETLLKRTGCPMKAIGSMLPVRVFTSPQPRTVSPSGPARGTRLRQGPLLGCVR